MNTNTIPTWNLDDIFTDFSSEKYISMYEKFSGNIRELEKMLEHKPPQDKDGLENSLTGIIKLYNETGSIYEELFSYSYCRYSTDTSEPQALSEINRIEAIAVGFSTAVVKLRNYLFKAGQLLDEVIAGSDYLGQFRFFFDEQLMLREKQMTPEMENLAADLARSGADSWERLQQTLSSATQIVWDEETGEKKTSVELRALADNPDESVRRKAFEKEIELWKSIEVPMAFALNGVKGASNSVNSRRNFKTTLERSTLQARITSDTLDAIISAMTTSLPVFRKYLKLKAGLLGKEKIAFYDLFAPVGESSMSFSYKEATDFIVDKFTNFSTDLGNFARKAVDKGWIDAKPRQNKVGGAYCTGFHVSGASRILCNFNGSFNALSTIAHELGHAYHNDVLKEAPEIYRDFPMTLAETASIFCETIVLESALETASGDDKLNLIEHELMESTQIIVDILSRFIFEKNVFNKRIEKELSAAEFCELMIDAQKQTYGDAMNEKLMHPYMWAAKGHYYSQELAFYNFPYSFGKLFGLGLYSRFRDEGESFPEKYRSILYMTGNASAEDVTAIAGYDITKKDFWQSSLSIMEKRVEQFEDLCKNRK
ncbi:MAG: M3 family oligoendopeptidase [Spirochaetales bacterium]|uniref:M3 family oligoendopeptidase n=1 Tax=Candidatus Thalassospirochaeta sargassi TaxID=3119039 RepID=A0AAJ1ICN5_9SPIO|nr:M3 family oligoendopeptidase [Spirochaetales bacterium]